MDTYTVSPSGIGSYITCPRRYDWGSVQGYKPRNVSPYQRKANRGSLIHRFLEIYYQEIINGKVRRDIPAEIAGQIRAESIKYPVDDLDEIMTTMFDYVKYYESERWVPVASEQPFSVLLFEGPEYRILLEGKIDLIAHVPTNSLNIVVDHKSTMREEQIPRHNLQLMTYSLVTGLSVVVVNEIDLRANLKPHERFTRYNRSYSKKKLAEFQQWITTWAIQMVESERQNLFAPGYSSCKYCAFESVCAQEEGKGRQFQLDMHFVKHPRFDLFAKEKDAGETVGDEVQVSPSEEG